MYDRFLFIGLGGSGGSTLGRIKEALRVWLAEHDLEPDIPAGWQFLHIDTPTVSDSDPSLPADEYLGLVTSAVQFANIQRMLDSDENLHDEIQTWRVEPTGLNISVAKGAGQFRAIGQTISIAYSKRIRDKIEQSVGRLSKPKAKADLAEVYGSVTGELAGSESPLRIVIISSLAGGTGAGLLQTVCDIVRALETEALDDIFGVLYTPEVFHSLGGASTGGVQPNSLAAISELLNGYWWNGAATANTGDVLVDPKESAAMTRAGLPQALTRSGPSFPFLVGRVGQGGIDHGDPPDIFKMVGRSLLSWITDAEVQRDFIAFNIGNWASSAMNNLQGNGVLVDEGATEEIGYPAFSALGFSRLSTGADYFETYCARRLVRDALDQVARFHTGSEMARTLATKLDTEDPQVIADAIADEHLMSFMHRCGLSELGPVENDILDAIRPPTKDQMYEDFLAEIKRFSGIQEEKTSQKTEEWRESLYDSLNNAQPGFLAGYHAAMEESTASWIPLVQGNVEVTVEEMVARYGLKATSSMCTKAAAQLRTEVADDLRTRDFANNNSWSTHWRDYSDEKLEDAWGKKIDSTDTRLGDATRVAAYYASLGGEAVLAERCAALAEEVAKRVLVPIAKALDDALYRSEQGLDEGGEWPAWSDADVPRDMEPPPSELPLIQPDDYNGLFVEMLADSVTEELKGAVRQEVRSKVISGDFLRRQYEDGVLHDSDGLLCVAIDHEWWPGPSATQGRLESPTDLGVKVNVDLGRLEARARAWLHLTGSVFGDFLSTSLRSYLGSSSLMDSGRTSQREYDRRIKRFFAQWDAAMEVAKPLINLDAGLMPTVHPDNDLEPRRSFSQLPFSGHPVEADVRIKLSASGVKDSVIENLFSTDDSIKHVDITTSLDAPHSVLVIDSLLRPIAESWGEHRMSGHIQTFWSRRRARPVSEFIPAPQALISCMVRGWFTGLLLGLIDRGDGRSAVKIARINDTPAEFPFPYLSPESTHLDRLPLILEALGLAYVQVSLQSDLGPLSAYCELRDLGRSAPGAGLYNYESLHPDLEDWIADGSAKGAIKDPVLDPSGGPAERIDNLLDVVKANQDQYLEDMDKERLKWARVPSSLSGPPQWTGLWRVISQELRKIHSIAERKQYETVSSDKRL